MSEQMSLKSVGAEIDRRIAPRILQSAPAFDHMGDDVPQELDHWTIDDFDDLLLEQAQ